MQVEETAMQGVMPDLCNKVVLDLACGTGRYGLQATQAGAQWVIGVDNSAEMLASNPQTQLALATTEAIPLPANAVDVILCGLALGHLPQLTPSLSEISRILKPGGLALISDFHPIAVFNGGQRTFKTSGGAVFAVEHHAHLYSDYHQAARKTHLHIIDVVEAGTEVMKSPAPIVIVYVLKKAN
jgi:malonyl-CoA O-methyltransferase